MPNDDNSYMSEESVRLVNQTFLDKISSNDPVMVKEAQDAANDYTRFKVREKGIQRRILPPIQISDDELDIAVTDDKPQKIVEMEPDSPAAVTIPFATLPLSTYIRGRRYVVKFARFATRRFAKDVAELRTYRMDIRQVLSSFALNQILAEEDGKFFSAVNTILVAPGTALVTSGVPQWENIAGGITRETVWEMLKIMPSTPSSLEAATCVLNNITVKDVGKWHRDEMGGDLAQDVMKNGLAIDEFAGRQWIVTIKKDIVATNDVYMFAEPKFLGKCYTLEDVTMYVKREGFMLEFFSYECMGAAIGNANAVAKATFA